MAHFDDDDDNNNFKSNIRYNPDHCLMNEEMFIYGLDNEENIEKYAKHEYSGREDVPGPAGIFGRSVNKGEKDKLKSSQLSMKKEKKAPSKFEKDTWKEIKTMVAEKNQLNALTNLKQFVTSRTSDSKNKIPLIPLITRQVVNYDSAESAKVIFGEIESDIEIEATISKKAVERDTRILTVGSVVLLKKVQVYCPRPLKYHLIISEKNTTRIWLPPEDDKSVSEDTHEEQEDTFKTPKEQIIRQPFIEPKTASTTKKSETNRSTDDIVNSGIRPHKFEKKIVDKTDSTPKNVFVRPQNRINNNSNNFGSSSTINPIITKTSQKTPQHFNNENEPNDESIPIEVLSQEIFTSKRKSNITEITKPKEDVKKRKVSNSSDDLSDIASFNEPLFFEESSNHSLPNVSPPVAVTKSNPKPILTETLPLLDDDDLLFAPIPTAVENNQNIPKNNSQVVQEKTIEKPKSSSQQQENKKPNPKTKPPTPKPTSEEFDVFNDLLGEETPPAKPSRSTTTSKRRKDMEDDL
ncbi:hypothetical protein ABK040_015676 [Willaertia magna]